MKTNKKLINVLLKSFLLIDFAGVGVLHGSDMTSNSSEKKTVSPADWLKKLADACNQESPDLDKISEILKGISDINTICDGTHTALHLAARNGHIEVVELLVERGADVNLRARERGRFGSSPLLLAAEKGHRDVVEYLLDHGADINSRNQWNDFKAIHWAVQNKDIDMVKLLIKKGANPRLYETLLHLAVKGGDFEIVKFLINHGADVNMKLGFDSTPLHLAVKGGDFEIVKFLINHGADVNMEGRYGDTALKYAVAKGSLEIVQYLIDCGADVNAKYYTGDTALDFAIRYKKQDIIEFLKEYLEKKKDRNSTD